MCLVVSFDLPYFQTIDQTRNRNRYYSEIIPCSKVENNYQNWPLFKHQTTNKKSTFHRPEEKKGVGMYSSHYETFLSQSFESCGLTLEKGSLEMHVRLYSEPELNPFLLSSRSSQGAQLPRSSLIGSQHSHSYKNHIKDCTKYPKSSLKPLLKVYNVDRANESPESFVAQHYTSWYSVLFSIVVENHSKHNIINPRHQYSQGCDSNKLIPSTLNPVEGGSSDIVVVHNDKKEHNVCGIISWTIEGLEPEQEIQVPFNIPYHGSCGSDTRDNQYSINISPVTNQDRTASENPILHQERNCITTVNENIRLQTSYKKGTSGKHCAPLLTLQIFVASNTDYMNYYVPISVSALICLIAVIILIICVRKCKKHQKDSSIHHKERHSSVNLGKGKPMHVTAVTQTDDVDWLIEDSSLLSSKKSPKNIEDATNEQLELAQVYMSVTSYDMVYMSQQSHDLVKNYRPSIPMPFMNQIKANSCEVITEQNSAQLHTVGERGESKCGSDNGSI